MHCVDTEGPMSETLLDTFKRVSQVFGLKINATKANLRNLQSGRSKLVPSKISIEVAEYFSQDNLDFLTSWEEIYSSLDALDELRESLLDDLKNQWKFTFFCVDHVNYTSNPRNKHFGFGEIHRKYFDRIVSKGHSDEIQWHYHPKSISNNPVGLSTNFDNSLSEIHSILCRRIIDFDFFPTSYRPGFHAEGPDASFFLEQWIPFDYSNQRYSRNSEKTNYKSFDIASWNRAPQIWNGYHPSRESVQTEGNMKRWVFRCLNIGSRHSNISNIEVEEAFNQASTSGHAVLAVTNHDYRDMAKDVLYMVKTINSFKVKYPSVQVNFATASEAARKTLGLDNLTEPIVEITLEDNLISIKLLAGELFCIQPYLALLTKNGDYLHDNLSNPIPREWTYLFSADFIELKQISIIAIAYVGMNGKSYIWKHKVRL